MRVRERAKLGHKDQTVRVEINDVCVKGPTSSTESTDVFARAKNNNFSPPIFQMEPLPLSSDFDIIILSMWSV